GVAIAVYASAGLSRSHLSPSFTISFWQFPFFDSPHVVPSILAPLAGSFCSSSFFSFFSPPLFLAFSLSPPLFLSPPSLLSLPLPFSPSPPPLLLFFPSFLFSFFLPSFLISFLLSLPSSFPFFPLCPLAPLLIG
ncbi:aquaporin, partial [Pasteurella multocida]